MTRSRDFIIHNSDFLLEEKTCSQDFIIHNSDFLLEERVCSRGFIIPNSDFTLPSSSVRPASSRDFIIPNSHFSLLPCKYLHVCSDGQSRKVVIPVSEELS